jgi:YidC/Oxa1 family membrane protein insertase
VSILDPLFDAVAWVISRIHEALSVPFGAASGWSWGLSIVLLVMLMRLVMVPLFVKQVRSQRKMQSHMPALQEIRKKYKNDKTRLNEETMKFYKENGINPLGGCLPLIAQLPVFWSLFNVLKAIADWVPGKTPQYGLSVATVTSARTAHIFGVLLSDKFLWATTGESWTVRAVILASVAVSATTTFLTMRQSAKRGMMNQQMPDPDQPGAAMAQSMSKNMMYIAPFFALTGLYWQYGLVIYWVTTNVWTLGQQHILFRNLPIVGSATVGASAAGAASGSSRPVVKSTVVKGSVNAAKSNGAAAAKSNGTAAAKSNASAKAASKPPGTASKPATAGKPAAAAKPDAAGAAATEKVPAAKASPAKTAANGAKPAANGAKPAANGTKPASSSAVNNGTVSSSEAGSGGRGLLGFGKKKPEPEDVPVVPETKIVRQQPVRQARSKRSGNAGNAGKR